MTSHGGFIRIAINPLLFIDQIYMLGTRLVFGLSMVAALIAALCVDEWLAPWYPFWFLTCGALMLLASGELVNLLSSTALRPSANSVFGGVLAILIANWVPHLAIDGTVSGGLPALSYDPARPQAALSFIFLCFVAITMVSFVVQSLQFERPGRATLRIAGTLFVLGYVGLLGSFIVQLRWFEGKHEGLIALVFLVSAAKGADTGAYTVGRLVGRHKLWPSLSPQKTVEGALGGLAFGVLASLIVAAIARYALETPVLGWGTAVLYGLLIGVVAQVGDLMESMIKRDCERKDASDAVPGFGGILDVVDSLIFAGPVAFVFWLRYGP
jgi:phosphatidate cytidylyltransferase